MTRLLNRSTQLVIDLSILSLALWAAFFLRFEGYPPFQMMKRLVFLWPYIVAIQYACLTSLRVPSFSWRYIGLREVTRIFLALGMASGFAVVARVVSPDLERVFPHAQYVFIPFGVILIDFALAFLGISGVRVMRRLVAERAESNKRGTTVEQRRTLLIGAGQAGLMVAKELAQRPDLGLKPVAFVDDDPTKRGLVVHGIPVLGTTAEIAEIAARKHVKDALITIAQAPGRDIRRIRDLCVDHGLTTKIIPGIYEIVGGQVNLSRIREVGIEDLLGREPVELDATAVSEELRGRVVMVTGAGGSIGSELCRQVLPFGPARLVLVERAENPLFDIHRELAVRAGAIEVVPCVADVGDRDRMQALFVQHQPDVVFHAAAHKHVPMMEWNPGEAVKNNVVGTVTLADLAVDHGVNAFVMISTDKAVNPTSVMGVSKRTAELYAQSLAQRAKTRFVTVRFGNVLGSAGSVIPIFKEQISRGGPVTVTHPDMQRYFMTIPEACQLVLQAGTMGGGGEIFVLDMGEPVKIVDLARDLIELSGFVPGDEIAIEFSGVRPGEKLFEELSVSEENADKTRHPKIFIGRGQPPEASKIHATIARLRELADAGDAAGIRAAFAALVPEYTPSGDGTPARPAQPAVVTLEVEPEPSRRALATAPS